MSNGNEILMGAGGPPAAGFPTIGTRVGGQVVAEPTSRQQTDPVTGEPKLFPGGQPMMVVIVQVQTDMRDPQVEGDDGIRSLWIGGKAQKVVREACVRAGSPQGVEIGGYLELTYVGDEAPSGKGLRGSKLYTAGYRKPNPFSADPGAQQAYSPITSGMTQTYTVPTTTHAQPTQPGAIPNLSEEQKNALRAIGLPV